MPSPRPWPSTDRRDETPASGHLEEPSWSRLLLELASSGTGGREMPLLWLFEPDGFTAFSEGAELPAPFSQRGPGVGAFLPRDSRIAAAHGVGGLAAKRGGLVTLWQEETNRCLLDLVAARTVALDGPPVAIGYTLADLVVELAGRRWSDIEEVYLVGFGKEIYGLEGARYLRDLDRAIALVSGWNGLGDGGARCFVVAPMAVEAASRAGLRRLLRLVEQTPFASAVCCDAGVGAHCTWQVAAHAQTVRLEVAGRTGLSAVATPTAWVERLGPSHRVTYRRDPGRATPSQQAPSKAAPSAAERPVGGQDFVGIEILVLGHVELAGLAQPLDGRPLLKELVTYLAMHPDGATGESCAAALWPERRVPAQTLANRLSEARRALGSAPTGRSRLVRSNGRHVIGPDVRTDWSRFVALSGDRTGPSDWRRAMTLVRGRPLEGLAKGDWAVLEGHVAAIETRVLEVAGRLGEHLLGLGDASGAEWSARRGLALAPWDERLYRILMRAAHLTGNRGGVEAALRSLGQTLEWSGDPLHVVHPDTAALYRRLMQHEG